MQLLRRLLHRPSHTAMREFALWVVWIGLLSAVEVAGRTSPGDLSDGGLLLTVGGMLMMTGFLHSLAPLRTIAAAVRLRQSAWDAFRRNRVVFGVDLRGTPPIPSKLPRRWVTVMTILIVATVGLLFLAPWFPGTVREFLVPRCYLVWLSLLAASWLTLLFGTFLSAFVVWAVVHDAFVESYMGQGRRPIRPEVLTHLCLMGGVLLLSALAPVWMAFTVVTAALGLLPLLYLATNPGLTLVWKTKDDPRVFSLDGRWLMSLQWVFVLLIAIDVILITCGEAVFSRGSRPGVATLPVTATLGSLFAWSAAGLAVVAVQQSVRILRLGRGFDPRRPPLPAVHITGDLSAADRKAAVTWLQRCRFSVRFAPAPAERSDVPIHVTTDPTAGQDHGIRSIPLSELSRPETVDTLHRQHEIVCRRLILRGIEKLLKRGARIARRGTGWWIGPQHWFILGLSRDVCTDSMDDREATAIDEIVGPPYSRIFPPTVRWHFLQVTRALQIDLIFVQDGVSFRRLARVLSAMFEIFDIHGGRRRAEELHFTGLPGVRVILHDFDLSESPVHGRTNYPEPDYDDLGRARILHVFKDRGESEELSESPKDWEGVPILTGV